jgi:QWRF family
MVSTNVEGKRRKKTESRMEEEHFLRILYSRHLQWSCINSQAETVQAVQKTTAEVSFLVIWKYLAKNTCKTEMNINKQKLLTICMMSLGQMLTGLASLRSRVGSSTERGI